MIINDYGTKFEQNIIEPIILCIIYNYNLIGAVVHSTIITSNDDTNDDIYIYLRTD